MGDVQLIQGVSERAEVVGQFDELIVRQIQPADVLGQPEIFRDLLQLVVGQVQTGHRLQVVEIGRHARHLVVRHVQVVDDGRLHLGRSQLLEFVFRHIQRDRHFVHRLRVPLDQVV